MPSTTSRRYNVHRVTIDMVGVKYGDIVAYGVQIYSREAEWATVIDQSGEKFEVLRGQLVPTDLF